MAEICVGTIPTKNIGGIGEGPLLQNFKPKLFLSILCYIFELKYVFLTANAEVGYRILTKQSSGG